MKSENKSAVAVQSEVTTIRPVNVVRSLIDYDATTGVASFKKSSHISVDEIVEVVSEDANNGASIYVRAGAILNLSKQLPDVEVVEGGGEKALRKVKISAYKIACEGLRARLVSDMAFYKVSAIAEALTVIQLNGWKCNPFALTECNGYLRKLKLLDEEGKVAKGAGSDPIVKRLRSGEGIAINNELRPALEKAKGKRPDLFKSGKVSPRVVPAVDSVVPVVPAVEILPGKGDFDKREPIAHDLAILVKRMDACNGKGGIADNRKAWFDSALAIAKLAGVAVAEAEAAK